MRKFTISYDEIKGLENFNFPHLTNYADYLLNQLEYDFPEWDIIMAFDIKSIEIDPDNREISILLK